MGSPYINSWMINRAFSSQVLQSAGQNHPLDRGAAGSEVIDDRSCSEAKGLEQSSVYIRPACPQVHSEKETAHGRISQWNTVAVPPIKRHEMVLARTQAGGGRVVRSEVLVDPLGTRKRPDEPGQSIAKASLSGLVAPEAG